MECQRGQDITDKIVMGLLCCKAVQKKKYTGTVRMQSQPLMSSVKADTNLTRMRNLYTPDNRELFSTPDVYFTSEESSLHWNLNSETSGDSEDAFLHCGDVLAHGKGRDVQNARVGRCKSAA